MSDSVITIAGNVTREPELRYTTGGSAVAKFGVAVNRRWKSGDEWQEQTSFFDVVCWGTLGENVAASIPKGSRVIVTGRLEQRSYETDKGEKRSAVEIVADDVGAAMKWATVQIERNERSGGDERPRRRAPEPDYYGGEEPF